MGSEPHLILSCLSAYSSASRLPLSVWLYESADERVGWPEPKENLRQSSGALSARCAGILVGFACAASLVPLFSRSTHSCLSTTRLLVGWLCRSLMCSSRITIMPGDVQGTADFTRPEAQGIMY